MDSEARCCGFRIIERPDLIISHKCYSGDLPIEIIMSDLNYIKSQITPNDENTLVFYKILEDVTNKLEDDNYFCRYRHYNPCLIEAELFFMLLPILDNIVNKISSNLFFRKLKERIEEDLNVRINYSSVKAPVNNPS